MKFSILSALFCLCVGTLWAETTDYVTVSDISINPGGENKSTPEYGTITVSVNGSQAYCAFEFDVILPEGLEFYEYRNKISNLDYSSSMYPYTLVYNETLDMDIPTYTHSVSYNLKQSNILAVSVMSTSSEDFLQNSGKILKIYVKANPYLKPGEVLQVKFENIHFTRNVPAGDDEHYVATQYDFDDATDNVTISNNFTAPVSVSSSTKWATFVSPCTTNEIPTGVEAYRYKKLVTAENKVYLQKQTSLEAYVPYLLYAEEGFTGTVTGTATATQYEGKVKDGIVTDGLLVGAITKQSANQGYVLQNLSEGVKFYSMAGNTFTIPTGKCYLMPADATSSKLSIAFEETDGIKSVNANGEDTIYDLSGRKLQSTTQHGIYIVNGKKVVK